MSTTENDELEKLREQLRQLSQKNEDLARENENLKEKRSPQKADVARETFQLNDFRPANTHHTEVKEVIPRTMCGVEVSMYAGPMTDNNGTKQLYMWFKFESKTSHNATISSLIKFIQEPQGPRGPRLGDAERLAQSSFQDIQFVKLKGGGAPTLSSPVLLEGYSEMINNDLFRASTATATVTADMKFVRATCEDTITFANSDKFVNVKVDDTTFKVNVSYISAWSEFFPVYFESQMKESIEGVYPIKDCTAEQFQEMLDVIYPTSKPINHKNVHYLIKIADIFIMPSLTLKCEMFLAETSKHNQSDMELLTIADHYGLIFTQNIILDRATAERLRKVMKDEAYKDLSAELRRDIEARYIELDLTTPRERPVPRDTRNNRQNNRNQSRSKLVRNDGEWAVDE